MTDEASTIKAVLEGDVDSFRQLVQRYEKPVISMIKNLINDHHICQDIAQDVFFTVYRKLNSYDPARSNFSTWLFTIAKNKSLNVLKKKRLSSTSTLPEKPAPSNPIDPMIQQEFFEQLDKALQNLPINQKTAFVLAEFENLTYQEIAEIEGTKLGTIKSRINRAKKRLAQTIRDYHGDKI